MSSKLLSLEDKIDILRGTNSNPNVANIEYERCKRDPYYWMINYAYTLDEHAGIDPETGKPLEALKPFPDKEYIEEFVNVWLHEPKVLVPKSRQMMMSWICVALYLHWVQFYPGIRVGFQSKKEDDANALIIRAKVIYDHQPPFLKRVPINPTQKGRDIYNHIYFPGVRRPSEHNSFIEGIPQGSDQTRGKTYSGFLCDEMAFQEKAMESYIALAPTLDANSRFTGISSAEAGSFFKDMVFDSMI